MNLIDNLAQFAKGKTTSRKKAKIAIAYTRVSTKEQADNNQSLATQLKYVRQYAQRQDISIIGEFGGTYESAKTDERSEFKKMIAFAKKKKVDLILVYSIDRFSRSGPNAVYISEQLRQSNIGIMSVTQPIDSMTASGELQQSIYFMFSQYENQQRREKSMAGTKEKLLQGEWVTKPPLGYDIVRTNGIKEIVINQKGLQLQKAFKKKIKDNSSFKELSLWLKKRGVNVHHKRLSRLARNVFYCGYMAHSALEGQIVKGNHKGLLSKNEFLKLNDVLTQNRKRAKLINTKEHEKVPLKGNLICKQCGTLMTGYLVRKKDLWYYKCNTKGCGHNTSAKKTNQELVDTLADLQVDQKYIAPIQAQLKLSLDRLAGEKTTDVKQLKKQRTEIDKKLDKLEERFVLGEIDSELYQKYKAKYQGEIDPIIEEIQEFENPLSNHEMLSKKSVKTMANLLNIWTKSDVSGKGNLLKAIYPHGISASKENGLYRTLNLNPAVELISELIRDEPKTKKRNKKDNLSYSALVARRGIEPLFPG